MLALLVVLPLSAADAFLYGTWKMRPSGVPGSLSYTTKLDGAEVPVYSAGKVIMTLRAKKTGPNTWEGTTSANGMTEQFRTTLSADGKVLTSESINGPTKSHSVFDRVH